VPPLALAAIGCLSLSLPLLAWSLLARPDPAQQRARANLQRGLPRPGRAGGPEVASGAARPGYALARRLTPRRSIRTLDRLLNRAGRPAGWPLPRLLAAKLVLGLGIAALSLLYASEYPTPLNVGVGVVATVVGYFLPELLLYSRGQERAELIGRSLADTLDQMTIAVEAGLSFDSAMVRAAKNGKGPLADELSRTLQDMTVGRTRKQAYQAMADRTQVPDLRRFVRAVIQADVYGIPVAGVLRTQAAEMRLKRRQHAEEKAMQIPVKVVFPLMLCILPVLFIVLLGPAAMDIVAAFK
jgi:tight adherence protein C